MPIRITLLIFAALFLCSCGAAAPVLVGNKPVSVNERPVKDAPNRPLKPVDEMSWTSFEGKIQKVKDFRGKVIILDFWATYCPPCIEEIPHLMELKAKYDNDLVVIGLHVGGEEDRPAVPDFVEKLKISYPLGTPEDALTSFIFGQDTAIPQTAIFDRSGKFVTKIVGFDARIRQQLDETVESAISAR